MFQLSQLRRLCNGISKMNKSNKTNIKLRFTSTLFFSNNKTLLNPHNIKNSKWITLRSISDGNKENNIIKDNDGCEYVLVKKEKTNKLKSIIQVLTNSDKPTIAHTIFLALFAILFLLSAIGCWSLSMFLLWDIVIACFGV